MNLRIEPLAQFEYTLQVVFITYQHLIWKIMACGFSESIW
jgi:hypothetical protein